MVRAINSDSKGTRYGIFDPRKCGQTLLSWNKKEKKYLTRMHTKCLSENCMPHWMSEELKNGKDFVPLLFKAMIKVMDNSSATSTLIAVGKFRFRKGETIQDLHDEALRIKNDELEYLRARLEGEFDEFKGKCIKIQSKHIEESIIANTQDNHKQI
ncbi:hypothetical protein KDRO_E00150 [Kluyveromyces lactis]|nr:hypothetical protein KDRO_E00150 [Kluyveromyces lactis]